MSFATPVTNREDAIAAYNANKVYRLRGGNLVMCENFLDACLYLLQNPISRTQGTGGDAAEFEITILERTMRDAQLWYDAAYAKQASGRSALRYADLSYVRE